MLYNSSEIRNAFDWQKHKRLHRQLKRNQGNRLLWVIRKWHKNSYSMQIDHSCKVYSRSKQKLQEIRKKHGVTRIDIIKSYLRYLFTAKT